MSSPHEQIIEKIEALNPALQESLGYVAINQDGWVAKSQLRALEKAGLIEPYEDKVYGTGNAPIDMIPVLVKRYSTPIEVHYAWATWCSMQPDMQP